MVRAKRASIAGLMGVVLIASFALAMLRQATPGMAGVIFLTTCGVLALAVVGVACRGKHERAWWLGCSLFGWGYLVLVFWLSYLVPHLPTAVLLDIMASVGAPLADGGSLVHDESPSRKVAHCFWSLTLALLGGTLAHAFFGSRTDQAAHDDSMVPMVSRIPWRAWLRTAAIGMLSFCLLATGAFMVLRWAPAFWPGLMLLLTWGVIGVAILGAVGNSGRQRLRWLGAALFGAGYMAIIFADPYFSPWPHQMVDDAVRTVFPWLAPFEPAYPPSSPEIAAANARIRTTLDRPITLHFPHETPLEDVLKFITSNVRCADGNRLPVYVDPIGLKEAEKSMQSTVEIDIEGVPLKTSLDLVLRQLGMMYEVREGILEITSSGCRDLPYIEDPLLSVGHCLITLLAAGIGSVAAPIVAESKARSR